MFADAKRFRDLALDCRAIAKNVRDDDDQARLEEIADDLDAEADKIASAKPKAG